MSPPEADRSEAFIGKTFDRGGPDVGNKGRHHPVCATPNNVKTQTVMDLRGKREVVAVFR
jgi:hypothetical protein